MTSGKEIGSAAFGSVKEGSKRKLRTYYDIAICVDYMRTHSGTSGDGIKDIKSIDDKTFEQLSESDAIGLKVDEYRK